MSRGRELVALAVAGTAVLALTLAVAAVSAGDGVSTGGDPHVVTKHELRAALARSGLALRFGASDSRTRADRVQGFARRGDVRLGFEFQLFRNGDQTTIRSLARLGLDEFGLAHVRPRLDTYPMVRGVVGNVAYATYEIDPENWPVDRSDRYYLRYERDALHIGRTLDDALFGLFPANDPSVHALSPDP